MAGATAITAVLSLILLFTLPIASSNPQTLAPNPSPSPHPLTHKHKILHWTIGFLVGIISGLLAGLAASIILHLILTRIRRRLLAGTEIFSPAIKQRSELAFLEKPSGLSDLQIIGRGGSGEVYLKQLPSKPIAIKRIRSIAPEENGTLDKWLKQIRSEIRTVSRIRHRNLLPLLAHVPRPDCHYLVYEYMNNGSLHNALPTLTMPARRRIAIGIAAGLEHLHLHNRPQIIHRDLKPANILLDENMEARISDFGFAKEVPEANTHMTMSNVAGTVGYIAPEYYQTMKYTAKCDVYSLGVILGVLVVGRFPSDEYFLETDGLGLVKWMRNMVRVGNAAGCLDGEVAGRGQEEDEKMKLVLRVACFCTADDPAERPSSKEVRVMLAQIDRGG